MGGVDEEDELGCEKMWLRSFSGESLSLTQPLA